MSKIHVKLEHDLAEFHYQVKLTKRALLKFHIRDKFRRAFRRGG
jgi:hypothetical protein